MSRGNELNISEVLKLHPTQLWLISVPELGDLTKNLQKNSLSESVKLSSFNVPKDLLRVGTLDQLIDLSDDMYRIENFSESLVKKLASYLFEVMTEDTAPLNPTNDQICKFVDCLLLNQNRHHMHDYIRTFRWDSAKYPSKNRPLREMVGELTDNAYKIEEVLKKRQTVYNNVVKELTQLIKKQTGSLLTRDLAAVIDKRKHIVQNSEYLQTLIVAVPNNNKQEWLKNYERLADYVVPRSTIEVSSDSDYTIFTVTLFQRCIDEFKTNCTRQRFVVRDFDTSSPNDKNDKNNNNQKETTEQGIKKYKKEKSKLYPLLIKWLQANYREAASIMVHIKCLKCFVDSVLRYGLPVKFDSILLQPPTKAANKLYSILDVTYQSLDKKSAKKPTKEEESANNAGMEGIGVNIASELAAEYKPYVFNTIMCNFAQTAVGMH